MAFWDARYSEPGFAYGDEPNDFLRSVADRLPAGGRVLCIAEGEGRNAVFLAQHGLVAHAMDQSAVGLEKALRLASERGVTITTEVADLESFDLGDSTWDGIVAIWCHLPSALRAHVHAGVVRALRPGGVFVLESYGPGQLAFDTGGPKDLDMLPSLETLKSELAGLDFEHALEIERAIDEGKYHRGPSATVQVLARKPRS